MASKTDDTVPVIYITKDWTIDDIKTMEDCDDAFAVLTEQIVGIETRVAALKEAGGDKVALTRALAALRWKRAAQQAVQNRRGEIKRARKQQNVVASSTEDKALLRWIARNHPAVMNDALAAARSGQDAQKEEV